MNAADAKKLVLLELIEFLHGPGMESVYLDEFEERLPREDCLRLDQGKAELAAEFERRADASRPLSSYLSELRGPLDRVGASV